MIVTHVHVRVKPDSVDAFKAATIENARNSVLEPGVARFDVAQRIDDPTHFVIVEVFRTEEAPAAHKETPHYRVWRDAVEDMMAEPRFSVRWAGVFPSDSDW